MRNNKTKSLIFIGILIVICLTILFSIPIIKYIKDPEKLRNWIDSYGVLSPIVFIIVSIIQTLIPFIPGEPFEVLAGYTFGAIKGTILCIIASSIASIAIVLLVRKYGNKLLRHFFKQEEIAKLSFLKSKTSFVIYSLIYILPGTPKDLLCYIGGLNNYELAPLLLVVTLGRIPSIITSTIPGDALGDKRYIFAIITYTITIIICVIGLFIYKKISTERNSDKYN